MNAPHPTPQEVSLAALRIPPAMRTALAGALKRRISWGPGIFAQFPPAELAAEVERDLALTADCLAKQPRLNPAFGPYLEALAKAAAEMATAYNARLNAGAQTTVGDPPCVT